VKLVRDNYLNIDDWWVDYRDWILNDYLKMSDRDIQKYFTIVSVMHETDFIYNVDRDENRAIDGIYNRQYYLDERGLDPDLFENRACSVLEMLAVLAKRMDSEWIGDPGEDNSDVTFILFLNNLFSKRDIKRISVAKVREVLDNWMVKNMTDFVTIFPIKRHDIDYKNTELWSQMMVYITENYHY
jgi:hypothetical protein